MKSWKNLVLVALAFVCVCGGVSLLLVKRPAKPASAVETPKLLRGAEPERAKGETHRVAPPVEASRAVAEMPASPVPAPKSEPPSQTMKAGGEAKQALPPAGKKGKPAKAPLKDPLARAALAYVGADREAEAYWYEAINDPTLPPHEREDLIEDLNEDGLPDPKHPTEEDLPLIVSRLLLIEWLAPEAMDQVNADAFREAYKDLVNLANLVMGGGKPVK